MDKIRSVTRPYRARRPWPPHSARRWLSAVAAAMCVILVATGAVMALTYAGPVTVTANMAPFAPNPVKVGNAATSGLSANYTPPSGVPEGNLSPQYDWSVSVEYKALQADSFGSPPSGSYTDSISPTQPSPSSSATLTFTPLIAGYWQVSASCGVTVTDTQTNQYWSGSGNAGPEDLTSYVLHIEYDYAGMWPVVDKQTQDVCVGDVIGVLAAYGPSDMTLQWTVKGSIIAGYEADNSTAKIDPVTASALTQPMLVFVWMDTDGGQTTDEQVKLTGTIPQPQDSPSVYTTFNVYRPQPTFNTQYIGAIALVSDTLYDGGAPNGGYSPGIEFDYSIPTSKFGSTTNSLETVQIVNQATVETQQLDTVSGATSTFEYTIPNAGLAGPLLDTSFPYGNAGTNGGYEYTNDSPDYTVNPLANTTGFGPGSWQTVYVEVTEGFTHNLLFLPEYSDAGPAIYAPLSQVSWGWTARASNGANGFSLQNASKTPATPPTGSDLSSLPVWNHNAQPAWSTPSWSYVGP